MNVVAPIGAAVQPCGSCSASRTDGSVALPECVNRTVTWPLWPGTNSRWSIHDHLPRRGRLRDRERTPQRQVRQCRGVTDVDAVVAR